MSRSKGRNRPGPRRSILTRLALAFAVAFVGAVLYLVIPKSAPSEGLESLPELKARLAAERGKRRRELQDELSDLELKNEQLRREIERLKGEGR